MENFIITALNDFGYLGILGLIMVENIFPPIPSEVILTFAGFMTTYTSMTTYGVIFFSTIGSVVGAVLLYGLGRLFTHERLDSILSLKLVRMLGFKKEPVYKAIDLFATKGKVTVLFTRCIPIVRSLISIPAGVANMHFGTFIFYTTIGTLLWNTLLVSIGAYVGSSWREALVLFDQYSNWLLILFVIIVAIAGIIYQKKKKN